MSFRLKVTLAFLLAGIIPYLLFSAFSVTKMGDVLKEDLRDRLSFEASFLLYRITQEIHQLKSQLSAWSKLQIMDDILVGDVDKRISKFLRRVHEELKFEGYILCYDEKGKLIASSPPTSQVPKGKFLILRSPVYASFKRDMKIGELVVLFSYENLRKFLPKDPKRRGALINASLGVAVSNFPYNLPKVKDREGFTEVKDFFAYYKRFEDKVMGRGWVLFLGISREEVAEPLRGMLLFMLSFATAGAFSIVVTSFFISSRTLKPLELIAKTARHITQTRDYSRRVPVKGKDELAMLSQAFNEMLDEIQRALKEIEEENIKRRGCLKNLEILRERE